MDRRVVTPCQTFLTSEGHPGAQLHRGLAVGNLAGGEQEGTVE